MIHTRKGETCVALVLPHTIRRRRALLKTARASPLLPNGDKWTTGEFKCAFAHVHCTNNALCIKRARRRTSVRLLLRPSWRRMLRRASAPITMVAVSPVRPGMHIIHSLKTVHAASCHACPFGLTANTNTPTPDRGGLGFHSTGEARSSGFCTCLLWSGRVGNRVGTT